MSYPNLNVWAETSEVGLAMAGTHTFDGATRNTSTPIRGTADIKLHYNRDGNDDILASVQNRHLGSWKMGMFAFWWRHPTSISGANTVWHDMCSDRGDVSAVSRNALQFNSDDEIRLAGGALGSSTQEFTATLTGGEDYFIIGQVKRWDGSSGKFIVRIYDDTLSLIEEQEIVAYKTLSSIWSWGMLKKEFTDTNPNATAFIKDAVWWGTTEEVEPIWPTDSVIHVATVKTGTPTYDDFTGSPEATNKWENVDDHATPDDDSSYNQSTIGIGDTERQIHRAEDGPTLSGDDVINGVMVMARSRIFANSQQSDTHLIMRENAVDVDREVLSMETGYPNSRRSHGLKRRPGDTAWTEAARNLMFVGTKIAIADVDSAFASTHQTVLPTADGSADGEWAPSTGTDAYAVVDEDVASPNQGDYISSSTVGHDQSFTFPTPTITGAVITGLTIRAFMAEASAAGTTVAYRFYYLDPDSVKHVSATFTNTILQSLVRTFFIGGNDPYDNQPWTAARIGGANGREFGVEVVSGGGTAAIRCTAFNVDVNLRSQVRNTALAICTVTGLEMEEPTPASTRRRLIAAQVRFG